MNKKLFESKIGRLCIFILICIIVICLSFLYYKINQIYHISIPCIFHKVTGLYCPGCGITRAIFSLIELDFKSSIHNNLLIIIVIPFLLIYIILQAKNWILNKKNDEVFPNWFWYILLTITIIFGILRNIPYFEFLRPIK